MACFVEQKYIAQGLPDVKGKPHLSGAVAKRSLQQPEQMYPNCIEMITHKNAFQNKMKGIFN